MFLLWPDGQGRYLFAPRGKVAQLRVGKRGAELHSTVPPMPRNHGKRQVLRVAQRIEADGTALRTWRAGPGKIEVYFKPIRPKR